MSTMRPNVPRAAAGFSLVELLLAFGLGLSVCALMLQSVMAEGHTSQRLSRVLRERLVAQRALELLRGDLQRATTAASSIAANQADAACPMSGRAVVLHLQTPHGTVTYSVGQPAEPIWRGQVLMRCGHAFGLDGSPSAGKAQNRVLMDGLASDGFSAVAQEPGLVRLVLRQQLPRKGQKPQLLQHQRLLPLPSPV